MPAKKRKSGKSLKKAKKLARTRTLTFTGRKSGGGSSPY